MPRVTVISPPFLSHARPLAVLGGALRRAGAEVTFASDPEFASLSQKFGMELVPFAATSNRNTGVARSTRQDRRERERLLAFLDATRRGAVATLLTQTRHRGADMLARPEEVLRAVRDLHRRHPADWYLVDQLNYPVTLAMHCLGLTYATYCPGHPTYIPRAADQFFGVPDRWPDALRPADGELAELRAAARDTDRRFTEAFNAVIAATDGAPPPVERAFALASPHARVFNYPPPADPAAETPNELYAGHCSDPGPLPGPWRERLARTGARPRVLVALGTFLSAREDVLRTVVEGVTGALPGALVIVAAGDRTRQLADLAGDSTLVEEFVPQQELLPHMDVMVHHGGNNSFTECALAGVPALALPFSSDQFAVAHDAVALGVARCLDPNAAGPHDVGRAVRALADGACADASGDLARRVRERGPHWAAPRLLRLLDQVASGREGVRASPTARP